MKHIAWITVLAFSMAGIFASAEPEDDYTRIARISYMDGNVSFQGATDVDWTAASINFPLQPGDRVYTGREGRAEIEFDEGSVIRMAESTDIEILSMRENLIQIRVLTGLSSLMVSSGLEFEVDTPAAAFIILQSGSYRFETGENGDTYATVRSGEMETVSHRFVQRVNAGTQIMVTAGENGFYDLRSARGRDTWDEWNDRRNADRIARDSRRYVSGDVYAGLYDLDRHGRWVTIESYGDAWIPFSVGASWSPYSDGRWCYRPGWGWTWVSYETWGWLPYHYGRWYNHARYGWCWLPGPSFSFNFWSPGLVTFYYGPSWVSWCPLGPGDYYSINNYYYNKRLYNRYVADLRRLHFRSPGDGFNRHVRGAFRTMEIDDFRDGRSRGIATKSGYRKLDQPWTKGSVVRERLAVKPTAASSSPAPDRRAERSKIKDPKPAVVVSRPAARAKNNDGYVTIKNAEIVSRISRRADAPGGDSLRTGRALTPAPQVRSGSTQTGIGRASEKRNERPDNGARMEPRTDRPAERGNPTDNRGGIKAPETKREGPAAKGRNDAGSATTGNNLRSRPQVSTRQYLDPSPAPRATAQRSPIVDNPAGRSGGLNAPSSPRPSQSSESGARSSRQNSGSRPSGSYSTRNATPPSTSTRDSGSGAVVRSHSGSSTSGSSSARSASRPAAPSAGRSSSSASSSSSGNSSSAKSSSESRGAIRRSK